MTESLDLSTCTPEVLAQWLLSKRFNQNEEEAQRFLQQAKAACVKKAKIEVDLPDEGPIATKTVSLVIPRLKNVKCDFYKDHGIVLSHKDEVLAHIDSPQHVVVFSPPRSAERHILIVPQDPVRFSKRKKPLESLCFACDAVDLSSLLADSFDVKSVHIDESSTFTSFTDESSSSTTSGQKSIACFLGVQDGVLYPLPKSLLFWGGSKALYLDDPVTVVCEASGARYCQLRVQTDDDNFTIFENIHAQETAGLEQYATEHFCKESASYEDDEEEAEKNEEEGESTRKRSRRKASKHAQAVNKRFCKAAPDLDDDAGDQDFPVKEEVETSSDDEGDDDEDLASVVAEEASAGGSTRDETESEQEDD